MDSASIQIHSPKNDQTDDTQTLSPSWWEGLCCWLTTALNGMEMTLERRENGGEWNVQCLSRPLQAITTHRTVNGVQILSISAGMNGKSKIFEIAGPDSVVLYQDPAGFPVKVEIKNREDEILLCFSGPLEPQRRQSSNAWGE